MMHRRWIILIVIYLLLLVGGWSAGRELVEYIAVDMQPTNEATADALVATAFCAYVVTSATPFVPGAEIGFGLILFLGAKIAVLVYFGMVAALLVSFLIGRFLPPALVASAFGYFGLTRASDLVLQMAPLRGRARLEFLTAEAPRRLVPFMLHHRYLALIMLLNIPGNSVIGGGGGIALTAGLSGIFSLPGYLAAVLIAVAPIPLFFLISASFA